MIQKFYEEINGDYQDVLNRLVDEKRIQKFILFFLQDTSFEDFIRSMGNHLEQDAFRAIHTLKGVCMNLGFNELFKVADEITESLRVHDMHLATSKINELEEIYMHHIDAINRLKKEL